MPTINARNWINRSAFIPEEDERVMRDKLNSSESVSFIYEAIISGMSNEYNFIAVALLLESQQEEIASLVDMSGDEPTVDTEDLRAANIPTAVRCFNSKDSNGTEIINVSDKYHRLAEPGDEVRVEVQMSEDDDGNIWLNGRILGVLVGLPRVMSRLDHPDPVPPSTSVSDMYASNEAAAAHWCNTH